MMVFLRAHVDCVQTAYRHEACEWMACVLDVIVCLLDTGINSNVISKLPMVVIRSISSKSPPTSSGTAAEPTRPTSTAASLLLRHIRRSCRKCSPRASGLRCATRLSEPPLHH